MLRLDEPTSETALAMLDFNNAVLREDQLETNPDGQRQQELSRRIDAKIAHTIKAAAALSDHARHAHLGLTSAPHAGCWLHTTPSPATNNQMDPLHFKTAIQRWLRMPILGEDGICPLCDGVLDKFGDHCLVCPMGGDRTRRHNLLRNHVYHFAASAGLHPELEKPGLIQPRPFIGAIAEDGSRHNPEARRPADVYLPRWRRGTPIAFDFAVTSGLRNIAETMRDPSTATTSYEDFKRTHLDTERLCQADGFDFCPVVVEAVGGAWGPAATKVLNELAKSKSMMTGEKVDHLRAQLYQNLGVILHRENARSVLKRLFELKPFATDVLSAAAGLQDAPGEA